MMWLLTDKKASLITTFEAASESSGPNCLPLFLKLKQKHCTASLCVTPYAHQAVLIAKRGFIACTQTPSSSSNQLLEVPKQVMFMPRPSSFCGCYERSWEDNKCFRIMSLAVLLLPWNSTPCQNKALPLYMGLISTQKSHKVLLMLLKRIKNSSPLGDKTGYDIILWTEIQLLWTEFR